MARAVNSVNELVEGHNGSKIGWGLQTYERMYRIVKQQLVLSELHILSEIVLSDEDISQYRCLLALSEVEVL